MSRHMMNLTSGVSLEATWLCWLLCVDLSDYPEHSKIMQSGNRTSKMVSLGKVHNNVPNIKRNVKVWLLPESINQTAYIRQIWWTKEDQRKRKRAIQPRALAWQKSRTLDPSKAESMAIQMGLHHSERRRRAQHPSFFSSHAIDDCNCCS
jgi:hypothetical protein